MALGRILFNSWNKADVPAAVIIVVWYTLNQVDKQVLTLIEKVAAWAGPMNKAVGETFWTSFANSGGEKVGSKTVAAPA